MVKSTLKHQLPGRLYSLHPGRVLDAAALLMRAVVEGGTNAAAPMREAALTEGAMLHHLYVGVSSAQVRAFVLKDLHGLLLPISASA